MSMIDRYQKKGGFVQLLALIETSSKDKQEKFLSMIGQESPAWEAEVRKKILSLDRLMTWNTTYLQVVLSRLGPMHLAMVACCLPAEKMNHFKENLNYKERKAVEEILSTKSPSPAEASTGILKLFAEARKAIAEGSIKLDKVDPEMQIPENIEEQLTLAFAIAPDSAHPESVDHYAPVAHAGGPAAPSNDEILMMKKKLATMISENQRLSRENETMKHKLEQIKKIA